MSMVLRACRSKRDDWSNLNGDVLEQISKRLAIEDYVRVQAVCKSWRLVLKQRPYLHNPHDQLPWLAIPPNDRSSICKFYNLNEEKFHHVYLPELRDSLCIGSSHGWMIVVDKLLNVFLLNPLTRSRIELPPIISFSTQIRRIFRRENGHSKTYYKWNEDRMYEEDNEDEDEDEDENEDEDEVEDEEDEILEPTRFCAEYMQASFFKKVVLSGNPSLTEDFTVMAICGFSYRLALCRKGADKWTFVKGTKGYYQDLIYWKQNFYAMDGAKGLDVCDLGGKVSKVSVLVPRGVFVSSKDYLVVSEKDLLFVARNRSCRCSGDSKTHGFKVYRLDKERLNWVQLTNLEDRTLFLGFNFGLSISTDKFPECKVNHIYFTDDFIKGYLAYVQKDCFIVYAGHDMGCYNLKTQKSEPLPCFPKHSWTVWPPPMWATLSPY